MKKEKDQALQNLQADLIELIKVLDGVDLEFPDEDELEVARSLASSIDDYLKA